MRWPKSFVYIVSTEYFGDLLFDGNFKAIEFDEELEPVILMKLTETALLCAEDLEDIVQLEDVKGAKEHFRKALISKMAKFGQEIAETAEKAK